MRSAALALVSVCALAACNPAAPGGGGLFPDLTRGSYRAEATVASADGSTMPVVMIRDGQKQRMEFNSPQGASVFIANGETGEAFMISSAGGQTMAMRMNTNDERFADPAKEWSGDLAATATRTGGCSVAGQSGTEWTRAGEGVNNTVCVTDDGIILRAREGERTVWETTSVQRGPQDASLFALPPGVQVMDLSNMGAPNVDRAALEAAIERARSQAGQ